MIFKPDYFVILESSLLPLFSKIRDCFVMFIYGTDIIIIIIIFCITIMPIKFHHTVFASHQNFPVCSYKRSFYQIF